MILKMTIFIWVINDNINITTASCTIKCFLSHQHTVNIQLYILVFELLERGEVLTVPTDSPLDEKSAWLAFRDVILGLEYRKCNTIYRSSLHQHLFR